MTNGNSIIPDIEGHSKNKCLRKTNKIKKGVDYNTFGTYNPSMVRCPYD